MASLAAAVTVQSSGSRESVLSSSFSFAYGNICRVIVPSQTRSHKTARLLVKAMGVPKFKGTQVREKHLTEMIEKKVMEATEVCEGDKTSDECKVAWDEVEEVSQAKADLRRKMEKEDPLESFCSDNPENDECVVFDD